MFFNIIIVLISMILENIFNLYLSNIELITPLFTLISLIFVYFYFKNNEKGYYLFCTISGFIYDMFFTNFYILNAIAFFICSLVIYYIMNNHRLNYITVLFSSITAIFLYNVILYILFIFFKYNSYSLLEFGYFLKYFIVGNLIYSTIIYIILNNKRFNHIIKQ